MRTFKWICISLPIVAVLIAGGCASNESPATQPAAVKSPVAQASGAQLWSDNCMRCHNLRGPETYSSTQWELAVHHMRLRANLTGEETDKITVFLKSAN